jgi:APA family basic amino acid/polyamine antiporter
LAGCVFLAFWVDWRVWVIGLVLMGIGLAWHAVALRLS